MSKDRVAFLDAIRGLASLFVLVQHVAEEYLLPYKVFSRDFFDLGLLGVIMFFFLSGYVAPYSFRRGFPAYAVSRFMRIMPLAIIAITVSALIEIYVYGGSSLTLISFLFNAMLINEYLGYEYVNGVTWTLSIEIAWYLLFAFYITKLKKSSFFKLYISFAVLLVFVTCFFHFYGARFPVGRPMLVLAACGGYLAYLFVNKEYGSVGSSAVLLVFYATLIFCFYMVFYLNPHSYLGFEAVLFPWLAAPLLCILIYKVYNTKFFYFKKASSILTFMGGVSFSLYLFHSEVRDLFLFFFGRSLWLVMPIVAASYLVSYLSYKLLEVSFIKLGKRIV